ncbi:MFS transporter [Parafannyhessea sp. LCP21S3_E6]|uniref:MFS transporter n=1 Tax=unclassified Parafannyhessea TaxID=2847323 RepID=UPI003F952C8D
MAKQKFTRAEKSWIMYDVGNSALVLLATSIIPIYFKSLADGPALVAWSYGETVASLVIALLMPILGSIADMQGMKKKFVVGTVGTGVVATVAMGFPTGAMAFLVIYVISSIMLNTSIVFYDALLVDATTDERMDEVSSQGYAWGYIGSCVPFIACLAIVLTRPFGMSFQNAMQIAFVITAAWWVAFTIPMLRDVEQTHYKPREDHAISKAFHGIGATLKKIWADKTLRYFIIAYFFYIDGVHTIIKLSTSYGSDLGIDGTQLVLALLVTQFVAFPSAIAYGKLGRKFGTKTMLLVGIAGYTFITLFAAFFLRSAIEFWFLAIMVGLFQGGIQALSRSEFGKLCPKEHANEYFGFFDIFGKYAAIMGTFIVGTMTALTGSGSLGVFSIVILFVIGFIMMRKVPDRPATQGEE